MRAGPLAPVQAATAVEQAVLRYLTGLGTITANTVNITRSRGRSTDGVTFPEGQQVKAGDLLAEIDPSQFKVALAQARNNWQKIKPRFANARRDRRVINNWQNQSRISSELDAQQALVSETEGTIKADEASPARSCNSTGAVHHRTS